MTDNTRQLGEFNLVNPDLETGDQNTRLIHEIQTPEVSEEIRIPNQVLVILNRQLNRTGILGSKEPYEFRALITAEDNLRCYIFYTKKPERQIVIVDNGTDIINISKLDTTHWKFALRYLEENSEKTNITTNEIYQAYKDESLSRVKEELNIFRDIELAVESTESNSIDLVNIYSGLHEIDQPYLEIQGEEQIQNPSFALFFRLPKQVTGFENSKVVVTYWLKDLINMEEEDIMDDCRFAIGDESSIDSDFKSFSPNELLKKNIFKALKEGSINQEESIALTIKDEGFKILTDQSSIEFNLNGTHMSQPINWSYGQINISESIPSSILDNLNRFDRRAFIAFIFDLIKSKNISDINFQTLNNKIKAKKFELQKKDIKIFIAKIKEKLHEELFGDTENLEDISEMIEKKLLGSEEGFKIIYAKNSDDKETFIVDQIELQCTIENKTFKVTISKSEDRLSLKAYTTEIYPAKEVRRLNPLKAISRTIGLTSEIPVVKSESKTQETTDEFEILLTCLKILTKTPTLEKQLFYKYCIEKNLNIIDTNEIGIYITQVDESGKPKKITLGLGRQTVKLIRRDDLPRMGDIWIMEVRRGGSSRAKIAAEGNDFNNLMNTYLQSNDVSLVQQIVNLINDPSNKDFPIDSVSDEDELSGYIEEDEEDEFEEHEDENDDDNEDNSINASSPRQRSLFDEEDVSTPSSSSLTSEQIRYFKELLEETHGRM